MFNYIDPAFSNGRYFLQFGGSFFKNATSRFFGLGQDSLEGNETNYTAREIRANWRFGVYANEVTQIALAQRVRDVQLQRGATNLPFTGERFGDVDGVSGIEDDETRRRTMGTILAMAGDNWELGWPRIRALASLVDRLFALVRR